MRPALAVAAALAASACTLDFSQFKPPAGSTCAVASDCGGPAPACILGTLPRYGWSTPQGYCSSASCASDGDCGVNGFCETRSSTCYGACAGAGQCQPYNADNRCFRWDDTHWVCLPQSASECDPTSATSCNGTGACSRGGYDDVGYCYTVCRFGQACAAAADGSARACYQMNQRRYKDSMGNVHMDRDYYQGWACLAAGTSIEGATCTFFNDCAPGYQCDFYNAANADQPRCRAQCRAGFQDCPNGKSCVDAFGLGPAFTGGAGGLCI